MLYLHPDLLKGKSSTSEKGGDDRTGEQRGGDYVARIQVGYDTDGSPRYKYFKTAEEHRKYLENRNKPGKKKNKETDEDSLKEKLDEEQEESSRKTKQGLKRTSLFVKDKSTREAKKKAEVKKSFDLFIWRID